MPYSRKLLNANEEIAVDLHPHWWYFTKPALVVVGAIIVGIVSIVVSGSLGTLLGWVALALIIVSVLWLIARYLTWATTHFVITSDRVIYRSGVLSKTGIEIPLERVNTVHFNQSLFERMVGAGDLVIESGAEQGQQRFTDIRNPDAVQREIHVQKEDNDRRRFTVQAPGGTDVAGQLEKLEGMLQRGSLTQQEFDAQKAKLLGN